MNAFEQDSVADWSPVAFALEFVRRMRFGKLRLHHQPSVRTAIAIPKFLTARYFRTRKLAYADYIDAAVLNTPYEDQKKAHNIARDILFPREKKEKAKKHPKKGSASTESGEDGIEGILAGLEELNLDIGTFGDLDEMIAEKERTGSMSAYDLYEELLHSQDASEQALYELIKLFGGPSELEIHGVDSLESAREFCSERLQQLVGALTPPHLVHGCAAGFGEQLVRETSLPWELAAALAGTGRLNDLEAHIDDLANYGSASSVGHTVAYLRPFEDVVTAERLEDLIETGLMKIRTIGDFVAMLDGAGEWIEPPDGLVQREAVADPIRALRAADWIRKRFGKGLHEEIYNHWADSIEVQPTLEELIPVYVPSERCEADFETAYHFLLGDVQDRFSSEKERRTIILQDAVRVCVALIQQGSVLLAGISGQLATELLHIPTHAEMFLALLDDLLAKQVTPDDIERVVERGTALGIDPREIYERFGQAYEQFRRMVEANQRDAERYAQLLERIRELPAEDIEELVAICLRDGNHGGMAVLLALNLGACSNCCAEPDFVIASLGFKGIGGGENLLKQWFEHGHGLSGALRGRIKQQAKAALLELGMDWAGRGTGSLERGSVPQNQVRPFNASDDLDQLDIEHTLDALIGNGKTLESINDGDLMVYDAKSGQATFLVLIDISGSMSGQELATCAISVVMLLGKLVSNEIAIALFESDTHVVKTFDHAADLDQVADTLLDLQAEGGTCVDAALHWAIEQFESHSSAENQTLFLLSDFFFFEDESEVANLATHLADLDVRFLGAGHGQVSESMQHVFTNAMPGGLIKLASFDRLPQILTEAISGLGSA